MLVRELEVDIFCCNTLPSRYRPLGIDYETRVMSAHRTPERVHEYAQTARDRGIEVIIAEPTA